MGELLSFQIFINAPVELLNLSLNAKAVLPEAAVLMAMLGTLLVDLAGYNMYNNECPSAGIITGIGKVHNRDVMVICYEIFSDITLVATNIFVKEIGRAHV